MMMINSSPFLFGTESSLAFEVASDVTEVVTELLVTDNVLYELGFILAVLAGLMIGIIWAVTYKL